MAKSLFENSGMNVSAKHKASHSDVDHGLGNVDLLLVILHQTVPADHPAEGAFDDQLEAFSRTADFVTSLVSSREINKALPKK